MIFLSETAKNWDSGFYPCYTPQEMLEKGVFEGKYLNDEKSKFPSSWFTKAKMVSKGEEPDIQLNYFKVKSRRPLSEWKSNGWVKTDKLGWFLWYCHYYNGRRLGKEDDWQIGRWRSFVARHMGQVSAKCDLSNNACHTRQRQGLLQWAWDSSKKFDDPKVIRANLLKFKG